MTAAEACALLVATIRDLSAARDEAASYKLLAQQAIHLLHDQHVELTRLREQHHHVVAEYRAMREQVIGRAA